MTEPKGRMNGPRLDRSGYELEFAEEFDQDSLDVKRWLPYYLPHWSGRAAAVARYRVGGGRLHLLIEADQPPWCPEFDGQVRVSSLQTGVYAGPVGGVVGQSRFNAAAVVREAQPAARLYTPRYGLFEVRAAALDDPQCMVAFWMIGYEDQPERSAEICVAEIFGRDVGADAAQVGMGVHPFGDPAITDDFVRVECPIDVRQPHTYSAEWTPDQVAFHVDDVFVRAVPQSPDYPMQLMLGLYEFRDPDGAPAGRYPKRFEVEYVRGHRRAAG
jgi:hypothetical protein